ncbi:hypothetical protein AJ80_02493 [Polytolypa hystricis UAMH7299]|uniref:Uncharacterized protein n=1 Tax=Polytolypa hystricis (strain UAMH7299) TaxID=1447883 RepID=A0A2B7YQW7_POLH7|nr:hypothetical protein AJ80_02493 [Polytolypa hystricis UAMH7299]
MDNETGSRLSLPKPDDPRDLEMTDEETGSLQCPSKLEDPREPDMMDDETRSHRSPSMLEDNQETDMADGDFRSSKTSASEKDDDEDDTNIANVTAAAVNALASIKPPRQHSAASVNDHNETDPVLGQLDWSINNLPEILYSFLPEEISERSRTSPIEVPMKPSPWGETDIRDFAILPDRISSNVEEFRVEAWFRLDARIHLDDITSRMNPRYRVANNAFQLRGVRFRKAFNIVAWGTGSTSTNEFAKKMGKVMEDMGIDPATNCTRGLTPGLIDPEKGEEEGNRIFVPEPFATRYNSSTVHQKPADLPEDTEDDDCNLKTWKETGDDEQSTTDFNRDVKMRDVDEEEDSGEACEKAVGASGNSEDTQMGELEHEHNYRRDRSRGGKAVHMYSGGEGHEDSRDVRESLCEREEEEEADYAGHGTHVVIPSIECDVPPSDDGLSIKEDDEEDDEEDDAPPINVEDRFFRASPFPEARYEDERLRKQEANETVTPKRLKWTESFYYYHGNAYLAYKMMERASFMYGRENTIDTEYSQQLMRTYYPELLVESCVQNTNASYLRSLTVAGPLNQTSNELTDF